MYDALLRAIRDHVLRKEGKQFPYAPAAEAEILEAKKDLGFRIPVLLRRIYTELGNGGFEPGYGILGLASGYRSDSGTLLEAYHEFLEVAASTGLNWNFG